MENAKMALANNKKLIVALLTPAIISTLPILVGGKPAACTFVLILMSVYWLSDCIPMAITSLLPVLLYPLFGIMDSRNTSKIYFEDICMLSVGSLTLAIAIEKTGIHNRVALRFLMLFGSNPMWLLLGMMSITGFISLWISNTATTSMMLPIVIEVARQLILANKEIFEHKTPLKQSKITDVVMANKNLTVELDKSGTKDDIDKAHGTTSINVESLEHEEDIFSSKPAKKLLTGFCISITYAASIGGTGSLVGTSTNLILKGYYDQHHPNAGLSFLTYMLFTMPSTIIMMSLAWMWLSFLWLPKKYFFGFCKLCRKRNPKKKHCEIEEKIRERYNQCGPMSWDQISVGSFFLLLALLWLTRDLYFAPGWGALFEKGYVSDTTPAILILFLLVIWPKRNIFAGHRYDHLIEWGTISKNFPFHILFLSGGGLALAQGFQASHLSDLIGTTLTKVVPKNPNLMLLVVTIFAQLGTEFTSNVSMESILLPIIDSLAHENHINPSFLLLPISISVSFAFLLPAATPTNAIVFASGHVKIKEMVISGLVLKCIGVLVVMINTNMMLGLLFKNPVPSNSDPDSFNATISLNSTIASETNFLYK